MRFSLLPMHSLIVHYKLWAWILVVVFWTMDGRHHRRHLRHCRDRCLGQMAHYQPKWTVIYLMHATLLL